jgi:hypothetical protein
MLKELLRGRSHLEAPMSPFDWLRILRSLYRPPVRTPRTPRRARLGLERLETRLTPAVHTWSGGGGSDHDWSNAANWGTTGAPTGSPTALDDLLFPSKVTQTSTVNDLVVSGGQPTFNLITIGGNYTLAGNAVTLGSASAPGSGALTLTTAVTSTSGTPNGGVLSFYDVTGPSPILLGNGAVSGGSAAIQLSSLGSGRHLISAVYSGDATFAGSSGMLHGYFVVGANATTTTSSAPVSTAAFGQTVVVSAVVTAPFTTPDGSVTFSIDGAAQTPTPLTNGQAALSLNLAIGPHTISVSYPGPTNFGPSSAADVALNVLKGFVLQGSTLTVTGSSTSDLFQFVAGSTYLVTLNGATDAADPVVVKSIVFNGQGGSTAATLTDTSSGAQADLAPGTAILTGSGYKATATGVTFTKVTGGPNDTANLYDSPGNDTFGANPTYSVMSSSTFMEYAYGFGNVIAFSNQGGDDTAYLYDGVGSNAFVVTPAYTYFEGGGVTDNTVGFKTVIATAAAGGRDYAYLFDAAGNNQFVATPTYGYIQGVGFFDEAIGFKSVKATAAAGGNDMAYLSDGAGSNTFNGMAGNSYLYGSSYVNQAVGFKAVTAMASGAATSDVAILYDTPGNDVYYGQGANGALITVSGGYGTSGFGNYVIVSSLGGFDQAFVSSLIYILTEVGPWH